MFTWIINIIRAIINLFCAPLPYGAFMLKKESGKMFVSGKGEVIIQMKVRKPTHVEVFFIDHPVTCDGNKHDHLEHKVHRHMFEHKTDLIIKWHVGGVREIEYIYH